MIRSVHIVGSRLSGGAERFYLRLVHGLHERGHPTISFNRPGSAVSGLLDPGIPQFHPAMRNKYDLFSRRAISREIARFDPDIVQTYMGRATRLTHLPRGRRPVHIARLGGYYKLRGYYEHAHAWVGNTRGICDYLINAGFPRERVFHITNFVDPPTHSSAEQLTQLRRALELPPDALVAVTAARFNPVKGLDVLLDAFARVPAQSDGRPVLLVIVGDGPLANTLQNQARALGINARVRWAGWQADPGPYYELADVVVFPSRVKETLGNVILEAWAHGKGLVTTQSRGALELSTHERDALQVPCEDAPAFAGALTRLLADEALRTALGAAGNATLAHHYTRDAVLDAYLDLYNQLLAQV